MPRSYLYAPALINNPDESFTYSSLPSAVVQWNRGSVRRMEFYPGSYRIRSPDTDDVPGTLAIPRFPHPGHRPFHRQWCPLPGDFSLDTPAMETLRMVDHDPGCHADRLDYHPDAHDQGNLLSPVYLWWHRNYLAMDRLDAQKSKMKSDVLSVVEA